MQIRVALIVLASAFLALPGHAADPEAPWQQLGEDEGIKTWKQEIPGQELPGFRGETTISAPLAAIRAVVDDTAHHTEWMHNCVESRIVKKTDEDHVFTYNRTGAPWPVWDRDVVLEIKAEISEGGKVVTRSFESTDPKLAPLPKKVVRMPRLSGFYRLKELGPNKTLVTYQVVADVGGSIPRWLADRLAKDMPYKTLSALRKRMKTIAP